ncbi:MAG: hypothetical protein ACJ741_07010 [Pyrinomonadaceae bacterium]
MLLPMLGFTLALIILGALATLVAVGDPLHARLAPFVGFICLFSGLGAFLLSLGLAFLGGLFNDLIGGHSLDAFGFFGGYVLGGLGGALFGLRKAIRRRSKIPLTD